MRKFNNKSGFTLIEIIVVLIIVGILAAIALPNLFSNVAKSRAEEALASISSYRPTVEGCIVKQAGVSDNNCTTTNIGKATDSANFSYALVAPSATNDTGYTIIAAGAGALASTDVLTVTRAPGLWPATGAVSCVGGGKLLGAC